MANSASVLCGDVRLREEGGVDPRPGRGDQGRPLPAGEVDYSVEPLHGATDKYRLVQPILRPDDLAGGGER